MNKKFKNAQSAFEYYYKLINEKGINFDNTKAIFNIGFEIQKPLDNEIKTDFRLFSLNYAKREWKWYLSENRNANEISNFAPIWKNMMDINGDVNSNYGWQWSRNNQLKKVVSILKSKTDSRKASISIYDGKEIIDYKNDTPCTYAINFTILNNKLNMSVLMRSNDLWFGFCNDQYCFSKLQEKVALELNIKIGTYFHFTNNLHIYNNFLNKQI
jgi:thymidylate synthase